MTDQHSESSHVTERGEADDCPLCSHPQRWHVDGIAHQELNATGCASCAECERNRRTLGRWVCPHDPRGMDRDTATYCPQAVFVSRCVCGHPQGDHLGRMDDCQAGGCDCPLWVPAGDPEGAMDATLAHLFTDRTRRDF